MTRTGYRIRQSGVAILSAMLLTALALSVVAGLFWQQQVQVRSIENQRLQLQKQWVLRGAFDWARLILTEDLRHSQTDDLQEVWATPLAETRLDSFLDKEPDAPEKRRATLLGSIADAQARLNLNSLAKASTIVPGEVLAFQRLLRHLQLSPELALSTARVIANSQQRAGAGDTAVLPLSSADDLLSIPGFSVSTVNRLRPFVIFLPRPTAVNVNTASAEILMARMAPLSESEAAALIASRRIASFRDVQDFLARLPGKKVSVDGGEISVASDFFLVEGRVAIDYAAQHIEGLIERHRAGTRLVWARQV